MCISLSLALPLTRQAVNRLHRTMSVGVLKNTQAHREAKLSKVTAFSRVKKNIHPHTHEHCIPIAVAMPTHRARAQNWKQPLKSTTKWSLRKIFLMLFIVHFQRQKEPVDASDKIFAEFFFILFLLCRFYFIFSFLFLPLLLHPASSSSFSFIRDFSYRAQLIA